MTPEKTWALQSRMHDRQKGWLHARRPNWRCEGSSFSNTRSMQMLHSTFLDEAFESACIDRRCGVKRKAGWHLGMGL